MTNTEQKQNIEQLPPQQKVVAVALKHIFDRIKKIQEEENAEVQKIHQSFISKFKVVEEKASSIIKGTPLTTKDLQNSDKFFTPTEKIEVEKIAKQNKGIEAYWLTAFLNFFGQDMTTEDKEIAIALQDVSTNVFDDRFQISFEIGSNTILQAGKITRKFVLLNGNATKTQGDQAKWIKSVPEGIFGHLFTDSSNLEQLGNLFATAGEIINEIVPYSLQFFLGATEEQQDEQEEEDDSQEQEQDDVPNKKVKQ